MSDSSSPIPSAVAKAQETLRKWWGTSAVGLALANENLRDAPTSTLGVDGLLSAHPLDPGPASLSRRASRTLLDEFGEIGNEIGEFAVRYARAALDAPPTSAAAASRGPHEIYRKTLEYTLKRIRTNDVFADANAIGGNVIAIANGELVAGDGAIKETWALGLEQSAFASNAYLAGMRVQLETAPLEKDALVRALGERLQRALEHEALLQSAIEGASTSLGRTTSASTADWGGLRERLLKSFKSALQSYAQPPYGQVSRSSSLIAAPAAAALHDDKKDPRDCRPACPPADPDYPSAYPSLIYVYWLDEAGLFWAAERLADRLHNGVVPATAPLSGVRLRELSSAGLAMTQFVRLWRGGALAAVGERASQYAALYGYPLHLGGKAAQKSTVDVMTGFPAAFNNALRSALQFYRDSRNLMILADVTSVKQSFESLGRVLDQGNENLRIIKPMEFRVQAEYVKLLLGGSREAPNALADDWKGALTPRPGVVESMHPWQAVVDAVTERYRLRSTSVADYLTLAESGEIILLGTRLLQLAGGIGATDNASFKAFLLGLEDPIQKYAASLAAVTGLDLRAESVSAAELSAPPAALLANRYPPPAVSPLRDEWPRPLIVAKA